MIGKINKIKTLDHGTGDLLSARFRMLRCWCFHILLEETFKHPPLPFFYFGTLQTFLGVSLWGGSYAKMKNKCIYVRIYIYIIIIYVCLSIYVYILSSVQKAQVIYCHCTGQKPLIVTNVDTYSDIKLEGLQQAFRLEILIT